MLYIHLKHKEGLFKVDNYDEDHIYFWCKGELHQAEITDFLQFAGGRYYDFKEASQFISFISDLGLYEELFPENTELLNQITAKMLEKEEEMYEREEEDDDNIPSFDPNEKIEELEILNKKLESKLRKAKTSYYSLLQSSFEKLDHTDLVKSMTGDHKFIIVKNTEGSYKFVYDPLQLLELAHADLQRYSPYTEYFPVFGGWLKYIDNTLYLYKSSGDYGVFEEKITIEAAKKLFNVNIKAFPGKQWEQIMDSLAIEDYPF